ncbi:MAG: FAD-dependent oxidoreductase [Novosphingobium sp.]
MARPLKNLCEVAVIGGGLAGLSAARHAARLGRLVTLFESSGMYGGQLATVDHVDGLPVPGAFSGQDLAIALLEDCRKVGVQVIEAQIDRLDPRERMVLTDWEGRTHNPEAVIVASGASLRKLDVPGEEQFTGRGVSRCASCDGGFYRDMDVIVVGGGDAAVHEALVLARTSRQVIMVCRSPLKAQREYINRLDARDNVRFVWDSEVSEVLGEMKVSGVRVRNVVNGAESDIAAAGVFPFIGVEPNTTFLPEAMRTASGHMASADRRIIAVGAVRADYGGMAVQAMAEGVEAAQAAHELLRNGA